MPTEFSQCLIVARIPRDVLIELLLPELCIRSRGRRRSTAGVTVPKAPIHENGDFGTRKDEIWPTREILRMEPVAISSGEESFSEILLRQGVSLRDSGHYLRARHRLLHWGRPGTYSKVLQVLPRIPVGSGRHRQSTYPTACASALASLA
jgi:hypothetical protein